MPYSMNYMKKEMYGIFLSSYVAYRCTIGTKPVHTVQLGIHNG